MWTHLKPRWLQQILYMWHGYSVGYGEGLRIVVSRIAEVVLNGPIPNPRRRAQE